MHIYIILSVVTFFPIIAKRVTFAINYLWSAELCDCSALNNFQYKAFQCYYGRKKYIYIVDAVAIQYIANFIIAIRFIYFYYLNWPKIV